MRYFAMIDGQQCGPFTLSELQAAGVRPDTYVWCKGMADWEKAEDVAEICRFYRQRIFDLMHPGAIPPPEPAMPTPAEWDPSLWPQEDISQPPTSYIAVSIALILLCFPLTGFVALYYAIKSRKAWEEAMRGDPVRSKDMYTPEEKESYARLAHEYGRQAKMWCGITFFLGFIAYAFLTNFL